MRASPDDITVLTVAANSGGALLQWRDAWTPTGCRLLVADNGSSDGFPGRSDVPVIRTGGNLGFGCGVNIAVAACATPLVLVTNPDTVPENPQANPETTIFQRVSGRPGPSSGAFPAIGFSPFGTPGRLPTEPWAIGRRKGSAFRCRRAGPLPTGCLRGDDQAAPQVSGGFQERCRGW